MTTVTTDAPRAWVGCLGCYNDGRLHGAWLDAEQASDLQGTSLADEGTYESGSTFDRCRVCGGDEWWVMDHEGIPWLTGECSPAEFVGWAEVWAEVDDPDLVTAYIDGTNIPADADELRGAVHNAHDSYTGFSSVEEYAENYLVDNGYFGLDEGLWCYFDVNSYARDLSYDLIEHGGYVFTNL